MSAEEGIDARVSLGVGLIGGRHEDYPSIEDLEPAPWSDEPLVDSGSAASRSGVAESDIMEEHTSLARAWRTSPGYAP